MTQQGHVVAVHQEQGVHAEQEVPVRFTPVLSFPDCKDAQSKQLFLSVLRATCWGWWNALGLPRLWFALEGLWCKVKLGKVTVQQQVGKAARSRSGADWHRCCGELLGWCSPRPELTAGTDISVGFVCDENEAKPEQLDKLCASISAAMLPASSWGLWSGLVIPAAEK